MRSHNRLTQFTRAILVCGLILTSQTLSAEQEVIDLSTRGPQTGDKIPEFNLPDQHGDTWTEESILGPNGTMLVFIRSANW